MKIPSSIYVFSLPQASFHQCLVLRPPADMPVTDDPRVLLEYLKGGDWAGPAEDAAAELKRLIQEHAASLPWASVALVRPEPGAEYSELQDALTWCTAASKQVGRIVLLDKDPNLERLKKRKELVLHIPLRSNQK